MNQRLAPLMSAKSKEWRTPRELFMALHHKHGFTLDAAASHKNAQLPKYYTAKEDGLGRSWSGERVWCNPPYGKVIPLWLAKAVREKVLVVFLVPARTDTAWWHDWVLPKATEVAYVRGRLVFEGAKTSAPFPSAIITYEPGARRRQSIAIDKMGRKL